MMWLAPNSSTTYNNSISSQQQQRFYAQQNPRLSAFLPNTTSSDPILDIDSETQSQSASSSPQSISQFPLSTFDSVPAASVPRTPQGELFRFSAPSTQTQAQAQALPSVNMMYADSWLGDSSQFPAKNCHRNMHQRESSLSSLGSLGPASPFSFNSTNPHIALNESGESFHGLPMPDDQTYHLAAKAPNPTTHDTFYTNIPYSDSTSVHNYTNMLAPQRQRGDRSGLLPPPDFPSGGSTNSRPVSVASSVASDSPVTPAAPEPEEDRRRKTAIHTIPKLDRTMTDIYSDELYNPNFSITSMSPSQPSQTTMSPNHEVFAQRLQAANSQHLSATHSPVSISRGRSPFRQGSPLAPAPAQDFPQQTPNNMRFNTAQHLREKRKAEQDAAQALRQAMAQPSTGSGTPQTISPKDAVLEFNDGDNNNNFPLFSSQDSTGFDTTQMAKATPQNNNFNALSLDTSFDNYLTSQLSSGGMQLPQQYPFVAKHRQQSSLPSVSNGSYSVSSRLSSSTSASPVSTALGSPQRPDAVGADGGTYTCTYHGCTMRFESPTLLQKHKREGHRQAHGLNGLRRPEAVPASFLNTQAGPHKCERINPSTGKPCNTVFSRPYDLTRHEDTIHNARKQKVRCDVCTEEKTFSRADALTRHYRVCHPDLEFPGKHRKRGGAPS